MLILMPNASVLWMAAGMLWILDASINVSMEPFRAFVADILPEGQRTSGFAMQSLFIGLGAVVASVLPYALSNWFHMQQAVGDTRAVPTVTRLSFYIGAAAFLGAVLWTIITTKEYPPEDLQAFRQAKLKKTGLGANAREIFTAIAEMPDTMRKLGPVQLCTWLGLFCMWLYFPVAVAHNIFGADDTHSPRYQAGVQWGGNCFAVYSFVCFLFSFALPGLARRLGRKHTHSVCLLMGALGLISVAVIHNKYMLLLSMVGVGIAWASTLSMPYAVLAASLPPARTGVYMGIFNFFIVTPEILASLFFGWIMIHFLNNNRIYAIIAGGVFLLIAAALMQRVRDPQTLSVQDI
jgi:maltose/moltooligosaccharide transporter